MREINSKTFVSVGIALAVAVTTTLAAECDDKGGSKFTKKKGDCRICGGGENGYEDDGADCSYTEAKQEIFCDCNDLHNCVDTDTTVNTEIREVSGECSSGLCDQNLNAGKWEPTADPDNITDSEDCSS